MILVIDNYDSFTYNLVHLVGRRTSDLEVVRNDVLDVDAVRDLAPRGILISPGPGRPADAGVTEELVSALGASVPILGVCLGHQAIGEVYGGRIGYAPTLMHGKTSEIAHDGHGVFRNVSNPFTATRYHSLVVDRASVPACLDISAETKDGVVMGLRHREHPVEGIQFHPESVLTKEGPRIVNNWLEEVLGSTVDSTTGTPAAIS
ncbi:MAG: aminodeoxychorismate/anthranilate synthase component II [Bacteroidetes bacterium SB0662_bin_6]|nr:aminodeoxychorismate/anthranilate synthase component II [Bacteroidetes bacterium SB0668_bin_1]MYE03434.1 aminodeoxychorismate/anthranilate synthase component II [Bacteroidetes bacterium SB0662_bin_6]